MGPTIIGAVITAVAVVIAAVIQSGRLGQSPPTPKPGDAPIPAIPSVDLHTPAPKQTAKPGSCEKALRDDLAVQRLLEHKSWRLTAEAAIRYLIRGEEPIDDGWKTTKTWKQIKGVYDKLPPCRSAERETDR
jgi:hypothetical protein